MQRILAKVRRLPSSADHSVYHLVIVVDASSAYYAFPLH